MANPIIDPNAFFEKTAQYASQGRGVFTLTRPPDVFGSARKMTEEINMGWQLLQTGLVAKSITSPSSSLATFEEFSYIGPTRKQPHTQIFGPIGVEFYLMGKNVKEAQSIYKTFLMWHEYIVGPKFPSNTSDRSVRSDSTFYAIEYYDRYVTDAEFTVQSTWGGDAISTPIIHNKYYELYPQSVGQISTSWDSPDSPLTLSVDFEFYYMQSLV